MGNICFLSGKRKTEARLSLAPIIFYSTVLVATMSTPVPQMSLTTTS